MRQPRALVTERQAGWQVRRLQQVQCTSILNPSPEPYTPNDASHKSYAKLLLETHPCSVLRRGGERGFGRLHLGRRAHVCLSLGVNGPADALSHASEALTPERW